MFCSVRHVIKCLFLAAVFTVLAAGCDVPDDAASVEADLRVAIPVGVEAVPLIAALENGLFAGIQVELVPVSDRVELETVLQSGAVDGAIGDLFSLVKLQEQGFFVMAASISGADYVIVTASAEIDSMEDLAGASLAVTEEPFVQYLLETMLQQYGLDPAGLEYYYTPNSAEALNAMSQNRATGAFVPRHLGEEAFRGGEAVLGSTLEQDLQGGVIIFSGEALQDKEAHIQMFYRGYLHALALLNRGGSIDLTYLVEKWGYPEWWLERKHGSFPVIRQLTREEVHDALAWYPMPETMEIVPSFEGLVWREPFWE